MEKKHLILLAVNLALILSAGFVFIFKLNYEFIIYVGVIIFFLFLVAYSAKKVEYTDATLVSLTIWSALHLAGGSIPVGDGRLYDVMLIELSSRLPIFRYDQLVHIWGFGACTLVAFSLLRKRLVSPVRFNIPLALVLTMAGLGVGAFNEILEFVVDQTVPESGVGGYINTSLDLCANLVGTILGMTYIYFRYLRETSVRNS
jgi:putative membrane protein